MGKYRIYIDETGNPDLKSSDNPNHRFLSLSGVILELNYVRDVLHKDLEYIKDEFFDQHPDNKIILHRKEIINKKYPFHSLRDKKIEKRFNKYFLNKLRNWQFILVTVLLDKKEHKEKYQTWKYDPYHYCLSVLLERYVFILMKKKQVGDVMIESRGGKEDMRLKKSFKSLYNNGTEYIEAKHFQKYFTSKRIKVKPKYANIPGLQLADLIANPSRRQILIEKKFVKKRKNMFTNKIIEIINNKYYKDYNKIYGYGLKKLP